MENIMAIGKQKNQELTLAFNSKDYDLFFTGKIGGVYIDAFFQGDEDPFTIINCWDYDEEKSRINNVIDFANHMEKTMDLHQTKGTELTLAFNCKGYDLFFTATIGGLYLNVFFQGDKYPFTVINCWDYDYKKSGINSMLDFTNHIVNFIDDNADDLPVYFANK